MVITSIRNESLINVSDTTVGTVNFREEFYYLLRWARCSEFGSQTNFKMFRSNISNHSGSSLQHLFASADSYIRTILKNRDIDKAASERERSLDNCSSDIPV